MENFPLPEHLQQKNKTQDVSSSILTKMSETTSKALTSETAASWVQELENTIQEAKLRIYERVHADLPTFERQLEMSKSVQTRLRNLSSNVDQLSDVVSNTESGLLPRLVESLRAHSTVARKGEDAFILEGALGSLSQMKDRLNTLKSYVRNGKLPEAVKLAEALHCEVEGAPRAVGSAVIMKELKNQLRTLNDITSEQISEAYSRCVKVSSTELKCTPEVQVRQAAIAIRLSDVLCSLSPTTLASHLSSLRRDLVTHFIDFPLQQPVSASVSTETDGMPSHTLALFPQPSVLKQPKSATLNYLQEFFNFISIHFFPALPPPSSTSFPKSLCRPTTNALLSLVLKPSLPSSVVGLPAFLSLVQEAVTFEEEFIVRLLGDDDEREVKMWAGNVAAHYGRKRRVDLLESARKLILQSGNDTFRVDVSTGRLASLNVPPISRPDVLAVQGDASGDNDENGWEFEGADTAAATKLTTYTNGHVNPAVEQGADDEKGWDFDDDSSTNNENDSQTPDEIPSSGLEQDTSTTASSISGSNLNGDNDVDESDAWGWGDGDENQEEPSVIENEGPPLNGHGAVASDSVQTTTLTDDTWGDAWDEPQGDPQTSTLTDPSSTTSSKPVKVAKRLEKFSSKGKHHSPSPSMSSSPFVGSEPAPPTPSSLPSSHSASALTSTISPSSSHASVMSPSFNQPQSQSGHDQEAGQRFSNPAPKPKETYSVSVLARDFLNIVRSILSEGLECSRSTAFSESSIEFNASATPPSQLIFETASYALDVYRAVYPVAFSAELNHQPERAIRFSNDCLYMNEIVQKIVDQEFELTQAVKDQLLPCGERLKGLGNWWFEKSIEKQRLLVVSDLGRAEAFVETGDQERFDECESTMSDVLRNIRSIAFQWQKLLPRSKYLKAIGQVVEAALSKVLEDVLALHDIPELESQKLSELCRILNALEGLFGDDPDVPSMVVDYVPSWLKYSYLSELLEASIADISYLFDEGALIDFEVEELANLVRALFADTPLRANIIAKIMRGHPSVEQ